VAAPAGQVQKKVNVFYFRQCEISNKLQTGPQAPGTKSEWANEWTSGLGLLGMQFSPVQERDNNSTLAGVQDKRIQTQTEGPIVGGGTNGLLGLRSEGAKGGGFGEESGRNSDTWGAPATGGFVLEPRGQGSGSVGVRGPKIQKKQRKSEESQPKIPF